jgi:hypothetical protein
LQKESELTFVSIKIDSTFIFLFHRLPRYFRWSALATHDNGGIRRDTGDEGGTWWRATVLVQEGGGVMRLGFRWWRSNECECWGPLRGLHRRLQEWLRPKPSQTGVSCAAPKLKPREMRSLDPLHPDGATKTWFRPAPRGGLPVLPLGGHEARPGGGRMRGRPAGSGTDESSRDEWIRSRGGGNKRIGEKGKRKKRQG